MKTFLITVLKIGLVALLFWLLLHNAPLLIAPLMGALGAAALLILGIVVTLTLGISLGLVVVVALLAVAFSVAATLAPIWLPVLAVVGLVALCRPKRTAAL